VVERISLALDGARVEWDPAELLRGGDTADPAAPPAWKLVGSVDWDRTSWLRVISASFGESGLAVAIARPTGATTPDRDTVAAARLTPVGTDDGGEALVSSEYDAEGVVRRVGVELLLEGGASRRIAGDRSGEPAETLVGALRRTAISMEFRLDGERGSGLHELIRAA